MNYRAILAALVFAFFVANLHFSAQAETQYAPGLSDVPLMPGLSAAAAPDMAFDNPGGRIVLTSAHGHVTRGAVNEFYRTTLPQLGWQNLGNNEFRRDNELLRVSIDAEGPEVSVRFALEPAIAGQAAPAVSQRK